MTMTGMKASYLRLLLVALAEMSWVAAHDVNSSPQWQPGASSIAPELDQVSVKVAKSGLSEFWGTRSLPGSCGAQARPRPLTTSRLLLQLMYHRIRSLEGHQGRSCIAGNTLQYLTKIIHRISPRT